jgi:hypothetical protein
MKFEFPVERIEYDFDLVGDCSVAITINGRSVSGNVVHGHLLKGHNILKINFTKKDPTDTKAYATLKYFKINDIHFTEDIKTIEYKIDNIEHRNAQTTIANNLYFGYVGSMEIVIEQTTELLKKAAWLIADEEFEHVKKSPMRGEMYREKNIENISRDAKFMFNGGLVGTDKEIDQYINSIQIRDLRKPIKMQSDRKRIENWINQSARINILNFDQHKHFSYSNGVLESVTSLMQGCKKLWMPSKTHFFNLEMLEDKDIDVKDVFNDEITEGSTLFFELPSPWYDNDSIDKKIREAKTKNCKVALDLTWLPMSNETIDIDLSKVDEIYFSMTKTWPLIDFRPAWRWSKEKVNDFQSIGSHYGYYTRAPASLFMQLIEEYSFDYVFDKHVTSAQEINKTFNMLPTNVLWFSTHKDVKHDDLKPIGNHYYLDEFVNIKKLLDFKGKYWW